MSKRKQKPEKIEIASLGALQEMLAAQPFEEPVDDRERDSTESQFSCYRVEKWLQEYTPNPAMLRHILVSEGLVVFQWGDLPGSTYAVHKHDEHQSHWIMSGSLELSVERFGTVVLGPGDRDFMPAGTYHSARVIGDEPAIYLIGAVSS